MKVLLWILRSPKAPDMVEWDEALSVVHAHRLAKATNCTVTLELWGDGEILVIKHVRSDGEIHVEKEMQPS